MQFLTVSETAKRLRVSAETVRQLCDAGLIKAVRFSTKKNGHRKILAASLDEYIEKLCSDAGAAIDKVNTSALSSKTTPSLDQVIKRIRSAKLRARQNRFIYAVRLKKPPYRQAVADSEKEPYDTN